MNTLERNRWIAGIVWACFWTLIVHAQVEIEYIAHSAFVVKSPAGTRVALDPYNTYRWLGYSFPNKVAADAVLITHPHYDHDAGYYSSPGTPVFRLPGDYRIGDVRIEGIRGKHADPYGKDFGQINTVWLLEAGGIRIAHLGDNGPLTKEVVAALGRVDVLMIPVDGQYHILTRDQIEAIRSTLGPRVTIPMHYRISTLSDLPESLGPIDPWLAGRENVRRLEGNRMTLTRSSLPQAERILVFQPSPAVRPWTRALHQAWSELRAARELSMEDTPATGEKALEHLRRAVQLYPGAVLFWWELGKGLEAAGHMQEAIRTLERGLAAAGRDDWEYTMKARAFLAGLYEKAGDQENAARQYGLVHAGSFRPELRDRAARFLRSFENPN